MKTRGRYNGLNVPAWALPFLINGDSSGLEHEEYESILLWFFQFEREAKEKNSTVIISPTEEEAWFCHNPAFSLPCNVIKCDILIYGGG